MRIMARYHSSAEFIEEFGRLMRGKNEVESKFKVGDRISVYQTDWVCTGVIAEINGSI